jgi:hypothetical protein
MRAFTPALLLIALRRAVPLWIALRVLVFVALFFARPSGEPMPVPPPPGPWPDGFWSLLTLAWIMLFGSALLIVQERTLWRESVLIGNLGLPPFTLAALTASILTLLELLLHAARP